MKNRMMRMMRGDWITAQGVGIGLLPLSVLLVIVGYHSAHPGALNIDLLISDMYANLSSELIGISITVLLIDKLYRRREARMSRMQEMEHLERRLGSRVNEVAKEAAEELRAEGWLTDGALQTTDLRDADLQGAELFEADLQGADLQYAKLKHANLSGAHLVGANLKQAALQDARLAGADLRQVNLIDAKLSHAHLQGVRLSHANLTGAHFESAQLQDADLSYAVLTRAVFDAQTTLPDGEKWSDGVDLARFTDPEHPDFWRAQNGAPIGADSEE